jgi:UDPglucose--hexose-1-phosphate uridylyltransferase
VHAPAHVESFADLPGEQLPLVASAWRARAEAAREAGFAYMHTLVNEGREAGASRAHSHSQLVWLREAPPAVTAERQEAVGELLVCSDLTVAESDGVAAVVHAAGRVPYETLIAPHEARGSAWEDDRLAVSLELLAEVLRRLRVQLGTLPWNAWLHDGPHWHLELVPRLTVLAGIELGAGIYVNTMPPEQAAKNLREAG